MIGVTGHRDLFDEDVPRLEQLTADIVRGLKSRYPASPLAVLSPLAEGADRLVARVALREGAALVVPLPLEQADYERDFESEDSLSEFRTLVGRADRCFVLPMVNADFADEARDAQYAAAGSYIARHSQILIALWDGVDTGLVGGTWQIVGYKLGGIPEPFSSPGGLLDVPDTGPVYHVLVRRRRNPPPSDSLFGLTVRFPSDGDGEPLEESHGRALAKLNAFNADVMRLRPGVASDMRRNRAYVIPDDLLPRLTATQSALLEHYSVADTLALFFQRRRRLAMISLFGIAMLAVLSFEVYAHLFGRPWILALYPLSLATAFGLYLLVKRENFHNKHLDYRALAEGLRVQLFWSIAGLKDEVAENYLRKHRTELEWVRNAIRSCNVPVLHEATRTGGIDEPRAVESLLRDLVLERWIEDQHSFFSRASDRDRLKLEGRERLAKRLVAFGIGLAVLVVALHGWSGEAGEHATWRHVLIVLMALAPAMAAAMEGYADKMAYSVQAKRYLWMSALFRRAGTRLGAMIDEGRLGEARELIRETGNEALEESGDWVLTHRERPPAVPH